jgi:hypothetical protein
MPSSGLPWKDVPPRCRVRDVGRSPTDGAIYFSTRSLHIFSAGYLWRGPIRLSGLGDPGDFSHSGPGVYGRLFHDLRRVLGPNVKLMEPDTVEKASNACQWLDSAHRASSPSYCLFGAASALQRSHAFQLDPPRDATHWSVRTMAAATGMTRQSVHRICSRSRTPIPARSPSSGVRQAVRCQKPVSE